MTENVFPSLTIYQPIVKKKILTKQKDFRLVQIESTGRWQIKSTEMIVIL